jgi:hypothetical protein
MALNTLTVTVSSGVIGRPFVTAVNGLTAGSIVEIAEGGVTGFGYSNGKLSHRALPYDTQLVILRERLTATGESKLTFLIVTAVGAYAIAQQAAGMSATARNVRVGGVVQNDGSVVSTLFVEDATGALISAPAGAAANPVISFTGAVSQAEGQSGSTNMTFTLNLTRNGVAGAIPFAWGFTGGTAVPDDFTAGVIPTGSDTFAPGETSKQIVIAISGDTTIETDDTLQITAVLTAYPTSTATVLGTILNDDFVTLGDLTLSDTSFVNGTSKTVSINGASTGSTVSFAGLPASMTVNSAARTLTYDGTGSASTPSITPHEVLAGATNTPHDSPAIPLTIVASVSYVAPYLLDVTAPTANSLLTAQSGWSITSGTTSGFKFSGTPQKLATPNLGSTGVFRDAGSNNLYVKAQYYPAAASRNRFILRWTDWSNYIFVEINNGASFGLQVTKVVGGTSTLIQTTITIPTLPGQDQFEMQILNDVLTVLLNGRVVNWAVDQVAVYNIADVPASSKVGYAAASSFVYGNVEVGALDIATRRISVNEVPKINQRERSGANAGKASITFKGTYNGPVPNRFRIYDCITGTDITGFSAQAFTATAASGIWTAPAVVLPAGVTEYRAEFWVNDLPLQIARTNGFFVGELIIAYGQSGANEMGLVKTSDTTIPAWTQNAAAWYYFGSVSQVSWGRGLNPASASVKLMVAKMASDLADAIGVAVGCAYVGSGGQEIAYLQKGNTSGAQLYSSLGRKSTTATSLTQLNLDNGKFGTVLYIHQGASDVPTGYAYYYGTDGTTGLTKLFNDIKADFGIGAGGADMYMGFDIIDINSTGSKTDGATVASETSTSRGWAVIRRAQHDFGSQGGNYFVTSACMDVTHAAGDGLHRDNAGYYLTQQRIQRSLLKKFTGTGTDGRGPLPTGVTRSGNDLIIQYSANGCNGLVAGAGATPSNYQLGTDNTFATLLPAPTSYSVDGTAMTVTLHFAAAVPAGASVRTFQMANVTQADLIMATYADGTPNCVLYPIFAVTGLSAA